MSFNGEKKVLIRLCVWAAGLIILLACGAARGALVTIGITGQVTYVDDRDEVLGGRIDINDTFIGLYKYDSDSSSLPNVGEYRYGTSPFGISLDISGITFESNPDNVVFLIKVSNDSSGKDRYLLSSTSNLPLENNAVVSQILWQLEDNTGTALTSDALPLIAPLSEAWTSNVLRIDAGAMHIMAKVSEAWLIPEPASAFLMAFGATIVIVRRGKRIGP